MNFKGNFKMKISYRSTTMNVISKPNLVELLLTAKSFQYLKVKNFSDLPGWFCPFILSVELYDCQWVIYKIIKKRIFFFFWNGVIVTTSTGTFSENSVSSVYYDKEACSLHIGK